MKNSIKYLVFSGLFATAGANAFATIDFNDKIYGQAIFGVQYSNQFLNLDKEKKDSAGDSNHLNYNLQTLRLEIGFNTYYKLNDLVHPFVGISVEGGIPLDTDVYKYYKDNAGRQDYEKGYWQLNDFFAANLKLGAKINLGSKFGSNNFVKNLAVQPYAVIGFNVLETTTRHIDNAYAGWNFYYNKISEYNVGLNAGGGVAALYKVNNKLNVSVAVEYKYGLNYAKDENLLAAATMLGGITRFREGANIDALKYKIETHKIGVKLGVQFL